MVFKNSLFVEPFSGVNGLSFSITSPLKKGDFFPYKEIKSNQAAIHTLQKLMEAFSQHTEIPLCRNIVYYQMCLPWGLTGVCKFICAGDWVHTELYIMLIIKFALNKLIIIITE